MVLVDAFHMCFPVVCGIAGACLRRAFGGAFGVVFAVPGVAPPTSSKIITFTVLCLLWMASW